MDRSYFKIAFAALVTGVPLLILLMVVINFVQSNIASKDVSAAADGSLIMVQSSPVPGTAIAVGNTIKVDAQIDFASSVTSGVSVAELVVKFDPAVLMATAIEEDTNTVLALNKSMDNTTGKLTVDVAQIGAQNLPKKTRLVTFSFQVKTIPSTKVISLSYDPSSTLGIPNILGTGSYGKLDIRTNYPYKLTLVQLAPGIGTPVGNGTTIDVGVKLEATGITTSDVNTAELVLTYPAGKLVAQSFTPGTNLNGLNNTIDNTAGRMTLDVFSSGTAKLDLNSTIATARFQVNDTTGASLTVSVASTSTVGVPNAIASNGYGSLTIQTSSIPQTSCGDGVVQTPNSAGINEVCDDGNTVNGDQCSATCLLSCPSHQVVNSAGNACSDKPQTPYGGTAVSLPGKLEFENYDQGGSLVAYSDTTTTNLGGVYRTSEAVDISTYSGGGGYALTHMEQGEWLEYTVNVPTSGTYGAQMNLYAKSFTTAPAVTLRVYVDGVTLTDLQVNLTGLSGARAFIRNFFNLNLTSGSHIIKFEVTSGTNLGVLELDNIVFGNLAIGCRGDYDTTGTVDLPDFGTLGRNYRQSGINCGLDIAGGNCLLDISDFVEFAPLYKQTNACRL